MREIKSKRKTHGNRESDERDTLFQRCLFDCKESVARIYSALVYCIQQWQKKIDEEKEASISKTMCNKKSLLLLLRFGCRRRSSRKEQRHSRDQTRDTHEIARAVVVIVRKSKCFCFTCCFYFALSRWYVIESRASTRTVEQK